MVQKVSDTYSFNMELIKNYRNFLIKLNAILIMVKSSIKLTRFIAHKMKHIDASGTGTLSKDIRITFYLSSFLLLVHFCFSFITNSYYV